ncbi:MAG TPA: right-handed parallel beta-helix repeat-containing protein [Pirellulales bacterium]|nr:right-handed parallel beta-helix repeat-containing protein [Pirellulales bacterium]
MLLRPRPATAGPQTAEEHRGHDARPALLRLVVFSLAMALCSVFTTAARGQTIVTDTGAPTSSFMAPLSMPGLQPFWLGYVGADRGLGFQGQYFSAGGLFPITTDMMDGTWFVDGRAHVSTNYGNFFSNIGIGRRQYVDFLNSIAGISGWYDYDGDAYQNYGFRYNQLGVSAELFNPVCDFRFNGYFPIGNTAHVLNQFQQNYLLYVNGIDTALQGADTKFSVRPAILGPLNGYIDLGGYWFHSPAVQGFGGFSTGFGVQPLPGLAVNMEVNHDEVFGTTGFVRVAFGLRGSPGNTRLGTRLLEPTRRNDHIVRFNQQPEIATNPNTGTAYNVIHVDNAAAAGGNGTAEHPFNTLSAAQAASAVNDIIYVHRGNGTTAGYDTGIVLKNNQMLLGSGNSYVIQTTEVGPFLLKAISQSGPDISNPNGAGITLANNDRVGGITISTADVGILGNNFTNTILEQNTVFGGLIDGIQLNNAAGTIDIFNNSIQQNAQDGIHLVGGTATFDVAGNTVDSNVRNGIFFDNAHGTATVDDNTLGSNGRGNWGGVQIAQTSGEMDAEIKNNTIQYNTEGIYINAAGTGTVVNANIHDNPQISHQQGDGIQISSITGATADFNIHNNPNISFNGFPEGIGVGRTTAGGAGIRLYTSDAVMGGIIANNSIVGNAGTGEIPISEASGIHGLFSGDSVTSFIITNNIVDGQGTYPANNSPAGEGVWLDYEVTNSIVQNVLVTNNQIINSRAEGFCLTTGFFNTSPGPVTAVVDATFDNNIFANNFFSGVRIKEFGIGSMRVTFTNNHITNNVSPNSPNQGSPIFGNDAGLSIDLEHGSLSGFISNNVIDANGLTPNSLGGTPRATNISGIAATVNNDARMGLQITGNEIDGNQQFGISLTDNNISNPGPTGSATMGVIIRDNMLMENGGNAGVQALTPNIGVPPGPNVSLLAIELTHNESSQQYLFVNQQGVTPNTAKINYADGGLNTGTIRTTGSVGTVTAVTVPAADLLIAPLLLFP